MKPLRRATTVGLVLTAALAMTACSSSDHNAATSPTTAPAAAAGESGSGSAVAGTHTTYPVDVTNCGRTLHFASAPQRIVSGWTTSTELLLDLGLGDKIVGQYNTNSGTPDPTYAAAEKKIPLLGGDAPTKEALLAAHPDLIWADGSYLFDGKQLPTIAQLNADGIQVMILSGFCTDDATKAKVRDVTTDLATLGSIFDVTAKAHQITASINQQLSQVATKTAGQTTVPVAMIGTYDKTIYAYAGVYSDVAALAGARNIYADTLPTGQYYSQISVEDVIKANPSTLVYLLSGSETQTAAQTYLHSTLPTVDAVKNNHVIFLPSTDSTNLAGVQGVLTLAAELHP